MNELVHAVRRQTTVSWRIRLKQNHSFISINILFEGFPDQRAWTSGRWIRISIGAELCGNKFLWRENKFHVRSLEAHQLLIRFSEKEENQASCCPTTELSFTYQVPFPNPKQPIQRPCNTFSTQPMFLNCDLISIFIIGAFRATSTLHSPNRLRPETESCGSRNYNNSSSLFARWYHQAIYAGKPPILLWADCVKELQSIVK